MHRNGLTAFCGLLVVAALLFGAGCGSFMRDVGLEPGPAQPKNGVLAGDRWVHAGHGVYWLNLQGYKPDWPLPGQNFVFGWHKGPLVARLWLLPAYGGLADRALDLVESLGWQMALVRRIGWQGRPALDAVVGNEALSGRLRLLRADDNILAVAVLAPKDQATAKGPELAAMIEGLRIIPPGDVLHTVRHPDETLSVVSMWYTGTVRNWPVLQKYNSLPEPKLDLGQDILIPAKMVWRWDPLPAWMVRRMQSGKTDVDKDKGLQSEENTLEQELLPAGPK